MRAGALRSAVVLGAVGIAASLAKSPTHKLTVTGGDLAGTVEIMDAPMLGLSNVFTAAFLDTARRFALPPTTALRYRVTFYLPDDTRGILARLFERPRLRPSYVVFFTPERNDTGVVLLPGPGDPWASWNHGTIIRSGLEGRWSYANAAWGSTLAQRLHHARHLSWPTTCPTTQVLMPSDSTFADVQQLRDTLGAHGLRVVCAYHGTFDGAFGAPRGAAVLTDHGSFAAMFFSSVRDAHSFTVTSTIKDGQYATVLRRAGLPRPDSTYGDADPTAIFVHGRALFDSFGQSVLDSALRASLGERR